MKRKQSGGKHTMGTILTMLIVGAVIIMLFRGVFNSNGSSIEKGNKSEVEMLLSKNFKEDYPATPREVVKIYLRIMTCFYNGSLEEAQLNELMEQARELFDVELLDNNPEEQYRTELQNEILEYQKKQLVIDSYKIQTGSAIEYYSKNSMEYAIVNAKIITRDEKNRYYTNEKFILRKDQDGKYRILGWKLNENSDYDVN